MKHEWILDVLADLKNFARANDLPALADHLSDAADLAVVEISSVEEKARRSHGDEFAAGSYPGEAGDSRRA